MSDRVPVEPPVYEIRTKRIRKTWYGREYRWADGPGPDGQTHGWVPTGPWVKTGAVAKKPQWRRDSLRAAWHRAGSLEKAWVVTLLTIGLVMPLAAASWCLCLIAKTMFE